MVIFLLVGMPASAASAQASGRCYPPPCAVESGVGAQADLSEPAPVVGAQALGRDRSAAPAVLAGLLAVMGSLTAVGLRRRAHIVRRELPPRVPTSARSAPEPAASMPARAEQRALRSSVL